MLSEAAESRTIGPDASSHPDQIRHGRRRGGRGVRDSSSVLFFWKGSLCLFHPEGVMLIATMVIIQIVITVLCMGGCSVMSDPL